LIHGRGVNDHRTVGWIVFTSASIGQGRKKDRSLANSGVIFGGNCSHSAISPLPFFPWNYVSYHRTSCME